MNSYLAIIPIFDRNGYVCDWRPRTVILADNLADALYQARALHGPQADVREYL